LPIERDLSFTAGRPLSVYAKATRSRTGSPKTTNRPCRLPPPPRQRGGHEPQHETFRIDRNSIAIEIRYEPHCRSSGRSDEIKTRYLLATQP
jgi:hypothetical protein